MTQENDEAVELVTNILNHKHNMPRRDWARRAAVEIVKALAVQGIEARRAETHSGSVHESPVAESDAP